MSQTITLDMRHTQENAMILLADFGKDNAHAFEVKSGNIASAYTLKVYTDNSTSNLLYDLSSYIVVREAEKEIVINVPASEGIPVGRYHVVFESTSIEVGYKLKLTGKLIVS